MNGNLSLCTTTTAANTIIPRKNVHVHRQRMGRKKHTVTGLHTVKKHNELNTPTHIYRVKNIMVHSSLLQKNIMDHSSLLQKNIMDHRQLTTKNIMDHSSLLQKNIMDHSSLLQKKLWITAAYYKFFYGSQQLTTKIGFDHKQINCRDPYGQFRFICTQERFCVLLCSMFLWSLALK